LIEEKTGAEHTDIKRASTAEMWVYSLNATLSCSALRIERYQGKMIGSFDVGEWKVRVL
jgi:hypothetical protein